MLSKLMGMLCRFPAIYLVCQGLASLGFGLIGQFILVLIVLYCYESSIVDSITKELEDDKT